MKFFKRKHNCCRDGHVAPPVNRINDYLEGGSYHYLTGHDLPAKEKEYTCSECKAVFRVTRTLEQPELAKLGTLLYFRYFARGLELAEARAEIERLKANKKEKKK